MTKKHKPREVLLQAKKFVSSASNLALIRNADHIISEMETDGELKWTGDVALVKKNKYKLSH